MGTRNGLRVIADSTRGVFRRSIMPSYPFFTLNEGCMRGPYSELFLWTPRAIPVFLCQSREEAGCDTRGSVFCPAADRGSACAPQAFARQCNRTPSCGPCC